MTRITATLASGAALIALAAALPASAQDHDQDGAHESSHEDYSGEVVIVGHPPVDFGLLASTGTLEGDALAAASRGQIGETLARLPGVSATSFAPGASRPVLRGMDGDRVRVLTDGIGSIDASSVSADHAVVLDTLTVEHIDVLHGPAVLLFGGQAIGGAVNALDKRIPREVPDSITGGAIASYGSAADERAAAGAVDVKLADRLVAHFDANWRKSNDLRVGGFVSSAPLRADLLADAAQHRLDGELEEAEELEELAAQRDRLPNSAARSTTFGAGLAFIDAGGNLGVSVQRFDSRYGVPARPGAGHGHDDDSGAGDDHGAVPVAIDLAQTRVDLRGEVKLGDGWLEALQVRGAYGDYAHTEFEGDEVGTRFLSKGVEARADLIQARRGGWRGRSGVQILSRKLSAIGEEAFFPTNDVTRFGLFTLQSARIGAAEIEAAVRYDRSTISAPATGFERSFNLWSSAIGASFTPVDHLKLGANYIRGARAPAPEELLSDGPHVATQSYELGNPGFRAEISDGFEAYVRYEGDRVRVSLTGYLTDFDSFITALPTGAELDELPVFQYTQLPARFQGFEASGSYDALTWDGGKLTLDAAADYTHARLKGVGPVPRIPPLRLRGGAELELGDMMLRAEVEWNDQQDRVAAFEYPVAGFTLVNLSADWHPFGEDGPLTLLLSANNLLDADARRAASLTRDFVPLAGRDIRVTAKLAF